MPESSSPSPLPPSDGAHTNPTAPAVVPAPESQPRQVGLTRQQMEALSLTVAIIDIARKPEYAPPLTELNITPTFLTDLELDVARALAYGRTAVGSSAEGKEANSQEDTAEESLVGTLRQIQSAARVKHLPEHPHLLEKYHIGEDLVVSRAVLETLSQNIIAQANEERPGVIDTSFIDRANGERATFLSPENAQQSAKGQGRQARAQRDELIAGIVGRRKKIQYAADNAWPPHEPANLQARTDFRIPADRPYSY